jgi:hypothetical protein
MFDGIRRVTAVHKAMRRLHKEVADHLGVEPLVDTNKSMKGGIFPAQYEYPGQVLLEGEAPALGVDGFLTGSIEGLE